LKSFRARLRSFGALPAVERRLALRAIGWLVAARAALAVMPFARLQRWVESGATSRRAGSPGAVSAEWPHLVRRAVLRAARTMPGSTCLALSLVAERLLRVGGHPARLTLGVVHGPLAGPERALEAHAWVESGGIVVAGDAGLDRFAPLATFGGGA